MVVDVGDEQHADGALVLRGQHLLDRHRCFGRHDAVEGALGIAFARFVFEDQGHATLHAIAVVVVAERRRVNTKAGVDHGCLDRTAGAESLWVEVLFGLLVQRRATGQRDRQAVALTQGGNHQLRRLHERAVRGARFQAGALETRSHVVGGQGVLWRADEAALEAVASQVVEVGLQFGEANGVVEGRRGLRRQRRREDRHQDERKALPHGDTILECRRS